jgi:hypothetical protein
MSENQMQNDDVFGARLGRVLRAPERLSDDFEKELVAAIRADWPVEHAPVLRSPRSGRSWWRTPMTMRLSPVFALPMAASLLALFTWSITTPRMTNSPTPTTVATQVVHDTVSVVRFVFVGKASSVSLVGDFNAWGAQPVALTPTGAKGAWAVSLPLMSGRHEYAFIVDGKQWVADPFAPARSDEFDTNSSIITVGT